MTYDYKGYPGTGICWYGREERECRSDQVYMGLCLDDDPRQWFTFQDLGTTYTNDDQHHEVLIQTVPYSTDNTTTAGTAEPRCLARRSSDIYLESQCNPDDPQQRFFALTGSFASDRFEIGQYSGYTYESCVTNAHHPKSGEVIEFYLCEEAREEEDQTSFWELYFPQEDV